MRKVIVSEFVSLDGKRLFRDGLDMKDLRLIDTRKFSTGTIVLTYQPVKKEK